MRIARKCFGIALLAALAPAAGLSANQNVAVVRPQDTGEALAIQSMIFRV